MRARSRPEQVRADRLFERIARDDVEPAGIARGDFGQRGERALVALDGDDAARSERQQRPGQPAGPGADLDGGRRFRAVRRRARCAPSD